MFKRRGSFDDGCAQIPSKIAPKPMPVLDEYRDHAVLRLRIALHGAGQGDTVGPGGAEWLPSAIAPPCGLNLLRIRIECAQANDGLRCESLVELDPVEVVVFDPGELDRGVTSRRRSAARAPISSAKPAAVAERKTPNRFM